ncbi:hypothetical protein [Kutzneria buriramensis]|uniref:Uncharacterized protein n=1 Tax=Kutzneria buriramensis TaxID=1045776 RepID=A0A3E0HEB6_9PSEU|nr:hypothetical protein [Kutzneria buriramensis]REH43614.1 hypothetical protein BCF44_109157 [Kutzneria buriramensis]
MALIEENAEPPAVSVPFGVGMAEIARAAARCGLTVAAAWQMVTVIGAAKAESLAIVRGEQPLTEGAVSRAAAALAAEDRLIGGGRG